MIFLGKLLIAAQELAGQLDEDGVQILLDVQKELDAFADRLGSLANDAVDGIEHRGSDFIDDFEGKVIDLSMEFQMFKSVWVKPD